jgi:hypothetical protein
MRQTLLVTALVALIALTPPSGRGQDKITDPPAARLARPEAYYASDETLKDKVRLSDEMASKLAEIVGRKSKQFKRTFLVLPRGYFVVGGKSYAFYGCIASDPAEGESWTDPAFDKFWEELNRVNDKLGPLKDFKP